jgi:diphthamide biosynthesis protein 7
MTLPPSTQVSDGLQAKETDLFGKLGGDDCKWKAWDIRAPLTQPVFQNKRSVRLLCTFGANAIISRFEAGVTSIQSTPHREHLVAVGRYAHYH